MVLVVVENLLRCLVIGSMVHAMDCRRLVVEVVVVLLVVLLVKCQVVVQEDSQVVFQEDFPEDCQEDVQEVVDVAVEVLEDVVQLMGIERIANATELVGVGVHLRIR